MPSKSGPSEAYVGWDWFTGYGEATVHFCPQCRQSRGAEVEAIFANRGVRPAGYPKEFAKP